MSYNPFLVLQAVLSLGASIFEMNRGNWRLCVIYAVWVISNGVMATVGAKS